MGEKTSDIGHQTSDKMQVKTFRDLIVYQKSKTLVKEIYSICYKFPKNDFALQNQIQRAVLSIPANIAEGQERFSDKESVRFFYIARASLAEVEVFLDIAKDLGYVNKADFARILSLIKEVARLINGLINYLKTEV